MAEIGYLAIAAIIGGFSDNEPGTQCCLSLNWLSSHSHLSSIRYFPWFAPICSVDLLPIEIWMFDPWNLEEIAKRLPRWWVVWIEMGDFHVNLRCAGTWALVAVLRHLSLWLGTWINLSSHSVFCWVFYFFSVFIWSCFGSWGFLSLTRRAEFKVPWGVGRERAGMGILCPANSARQVLLRKTEVLFNYSSR